MLSLRKVPKMKQTIKTISKKDFYSFVDTLIREGTYDVVGVKAKGKSYVFDTLDNTEELCLDYDVTILPPKKYFLPQFLPMSIQTFVLYCF